MTESWEPKELENIALLEGVEVESIQHLLAPCLVKHLKPDETLIESGKPNRLIYALLSGRLRIHLDLEDDPITVLEPGEIVGELSVIDGQATSAHVVADGKCRVLGIDEHTTWALMRASHNIAYNLIKVLAHRLRGGNSVISTTQDLQRETERRAVIDSLTGLYNRRWLDGALRDHMDRCRETHRDLSVFIMDLDGFKGYNDTYGHLAGDEAIIAVANLLKSTCHAGDFVARYGGEEFGVLCANCCSTTATERANRIRKQLAGQTFSFLNNRSVTASFGVAQSQVGDTPQTILRRADRALLQAKNQGRNRVV